MHLLEVTLEQEGILMFGIDLPISSRANDKFSIRRKSRHVAYNYVRQLNDVQSIIDKLHLYGPYASGYRKGDYHQLDAKHEGQSQITSK